MFGHGGIAKEAGSVFEYLKDRIRFPESVASFEVKPMSKSNVVDGFYSCLTFFDPAIISIELKRVGWFI